MSKQNKIIIGIISALCLVIILSITYAAFTGQLTINGTANVRDSKWDIHIVESGQLEPSNITGSAKVLTKPTASITSISDFALSLTTPGDYIEYTFNVINDGDYDAEISILTKNGVTCTANGSTSDPEAVKVCNKLEYTLKYDSGSDVAQGDTILSKETKTMVLKIKYQGFDDPSLLPNTNVSISGLGISISYAQTGNAKVNEDGTTPYNPYPVGREITFKGDKYNVLSTGSDYVTLLKQKPLTYTEMTEHNYGLGYINKYADESQGEVYDERGYGSVLYYSSSTCGYSNDEWVYDECVTDYNLSDIKHIVDDWSSSKFTNNELKEVTVPGYGNYKSRLLTLDELSPYYPDCDFQYYCSIDEGAPSWLIEQDEDVRYFSWTMSPSLDDSEKSVMIIYSFGDLSQNNIYWIFDDGYYHGVVRPVINVYKSAIQ